MPTQRTLLITIASLLVLVSFLIGYISGNKVTPQGQVTAQNNSESVSGINPPVLTRLDDPAVEPAGSSYNSVYKNDEGKVYLPKQAKGKSYTYMSDAKTVDENPSFVFRERVKPKKPYSWGSQNKLANQNDYLAVAPREQGDGGQYRLRQQHRDMTSAVRSGNLYYLPTPPQTVTSPYGYADPMMQNPYMAYPSMGRYYQQLYGR